MRGKKSTRWLLAAWALFLIVLIGLFLYWRQAGKELEPWIRTLRPKITLQVICENETENTPETCEEWATAAVRDHEAPIIDCWQRYEDQINNFWLCVLDAGIAP